jgi:prepilin-type N-terminal cleavage/methylation domain-containing protein
MAHHPCPPVSNPSPSHQKGFTLIELSIVLVIIGLIVGGVLVGQDLIKAAETRATITQIEKYNTAVNTFRVKFNSLPGDIAAATATTFGLTAGAGTTGLGDGNGLIDGNSGTAGSLLQGSGETGMFWQHLSSAAGGNLVDGSFASIVYAGTVSPASTAINSYMPSAKLSGNKYIYVYNDGTYNYYGLSGVTALAAGVLTGTPSVTVTQAYNMDKKVDDGLPTTGNVQVNYLTGGVITLATSANPDTSTTCYNSTTLAYSVGTNNGAGANCALSFRFQ